MIQEKVRTYEQVHGLVCHARGIRGYGSPTRQSVFLLGIAPGATELAQGRPFIGPAGKLLDGVLKGVGWPRERCYATNVYCMHKDHPEPEEIALCAPRLQTEIKLLDPRLIVLFGDIVTTAFLGSEVKLSEIRGHVLRRNGRYVMPTYHPAAVLHGGTGIINDIVRDLDKIKDIMAWPHPDDRTLDPRVHLVSNVYEAQRIVNNLPSDCPVAIDIETQKGEESEEQIDIFSDRLRSVAVSDGQTAWAFGADIARGVHWRSDVQWTMHNGMFDAQGIRKFLGVQLSIVHDTMLASYSLDERPGRHGLKKLSAEYLGIDPNYAINTANLADESDEAVLTYNALDAAYTARLANIFIPKMKADDVYRPYSEILIPAANAFTDISYRGVNIDQKKLEQLGDEWFPRYVRQSQEMMDRATDLGFQKKIKSKTKKSSVEQHLFDAYNWAPHAEAINLRSPKQLAFLLFDVLGLTPPVYTKKTGAPSTNKLALEMLEGQHEFVDMLVAYRKLNQVLQSYILGVRDDIREDGRLHPNVLLHGTRTGRLSYRKPPLQTMPRDYSVGDDLARVTEIIIPDNDDRVILGADYEKAEVWCAAYLSGDPQMMADLRGGDYHRMVAAAAFGKPASMVTKAERQEAKKITFGILYGSGADGLAVSMRTDVMTAEKYLTRFRHRYHVYNDWYEKSRRAAVKEGELQSLTGRKRRFYLVMGADAHKALNQSINTPIQGLANDVCLDSLVKLHYLLRPFKAYVMLSLHDGIYFDTPRDNLTAVADLVKATMEAPHFGVEIPVELKQGPSLGQLTEMKV